MLDVLVVEDREDLAQRLKGLLERQEGVQVQVRQAWAGVADPERPGFIVLDLNAVLPRGFEVCRVVRRLDGGIPVVLLRAAPEGPGGDAAADTAAVERLDERVRLALRRRAPRPSPDAGPGGSSPAAAGRAEAACPLEQLASGRVRVAGVEVALTRREGDLLAHLVAHRGRVVTREALFDRVWGYETRSLDVHVRRLRLKLGPAGSRLRTVPGIGYCFAEDEGGES